MCLLDGMVSPLQGCLYVYHPVSINQATGTYTRSFTYAENVDDIPAQQSNFDQGPDSKYSDMKHGLTKAVSIMQPSAVSVWAKKADYNASLFCYTQGGASIKTGECANMTLYRPNTLTDERINTVALGCPSKSDYSSARTVDGSNKATNPIEYFAGRFSIPHLQL